MGSVSPSTTSAPGTVASYLQQLPMHEIKVDQSRDGTGRLHTALSCAHRRPGHNLGLNVVAEG
jgi:hypothetical protein